MPLYGPSSASGVSDGDKGDIVVSGAGTIWTVDANAVTFAKMQAVSANVLLGNDAAGTAVEEIACTAAGRALLDDADAAAQRTTLGLTSAATTTPAALTKADDTNVTLALGGTPATALLQATSITAGWTGLLAVARGGTGAATAADARTSLGLAIGTDVLAYDATVQALSGANWAANAVPIGSGVDTVAQVAFAANTFPARSSVGNLEAKAITDFGLSLVDDADAAAARTTLGLGTAATQNTGTSGTTIPFLDGNNTHSGTNKFTNATGFEIEHATPAFYLDETDQAVDDRLWRMVLGGGTLQFQPRTDADGPDGSTAFSIQRNGNIEWAGGATGSGASITTLNASNLASGTVADARLPTSMATKTFTGTTTISALLDCSGASAGQIRFPATKNASADANTFDDYQTGTFTATATGMTTSPTTTGRYVICGDQVVIIFDADVTGVSNDVAFTMTGFPAEIRPARTVGVPVRSKNNSAAWVMSQGRLDTAGVLTMWASADTATYANANNKGFGAIAFAYNLI